MVRLACCLVLYPASCVRAQIVNIEDQRRALDSMGWYGQLDLTGNFTRNRNRVLTLGAKARLDRWALRGNVLMLADYKLVTVNDANALNAGFAHLRYGYEPKGMDGWRWETFTQAQYNEQLRLSLRLLFGTGIRKRLYRIDKSRAYLGVLYMYEYDELSDSGITYRDHRLSNYLTLNWRTTPNLTLASTTYYQPRLPDFDDTRVSTVATAALRVTNALRFTVNFSLTHDARVTRDLPDVPATNYSWTNGLRVLF